MVLALIGAGGRGSALGGNLAKVENTEFKYICEVNDQRGSEITKKLEEIRGVAPKRVTDMRRVFEDKDVDGVVVATPEHWHAEGLRFARAQPLCKTTLLRRSSDQSAPCIQINIPDHGGD